MHIHGKYEKWKRKKEKLHLKIEKQKKEDDKETERTYVDGNIEDGNLK